MLALNIFFMFSAKNVCYGQYEIVTFYFSIFNLFFVTVFCNYDISGNVFYL